jgi:hypothetical protein
LPVSLSASLPGRRGDSGGPSNCHQKFASPPSLPMPEEAIDGRWRWGAPLFSCLLASWPCIFYRRRWFNPGRSIAAAAPVQVRRCKWCGILRLARDPAAGRWHGIYRKVAGTRSVVMLPRSSGRSRRLARAPGCEHAILLVACWSTKTCVGAAMPTAQRPCANLASWEAPLCCIWRLLEQIGRADLWRGWGTPLRHSSRCMFLAFSDQWRVWICRCLFDEFVVCRALGSVAWCASATVVVVGVVKIHHPMALWQPPLYWIALAPSLALIPRCWWMDRGGLVWRRSDGLHRSHLACSCLSREGFSMYSRWIGEVCMLGDHCFAAMFSTSVWQRQTPFSSVLFEHHVLVFRVKTLLTFDGFT